MGKTLIWIALACTLNTHAVPSFLISSAKWAIFRMECLNYARGKFRRHNCKFVTENGYKSESFDS